MLARNAATLVDIDITVAPLRRRWNLVGTILTIRTVGIGCVYDFFTTVKIWHVRLQIASGVALPVGEACDVIH